MKSQTCIFSITAALALSLISTSTVQAATTTGVISSDGTVSKTESTDIGSLNNTDNLAIAYDSGDGSDTGSATATSNVNVNVISGLLTLDAVPNFSFGNAAAGSTVNLKDNSTEGNIVVDGNSDGILQVTESRQNSDNSTPGFVLSARLNAFTNNGNEVNGFTMTLNPEELYDGTGNSASTSSDKLMTEKAKLNAGSNQDTNVMNLAAGSYKTGTITTSFTDSNSASLYVPSNAGDLTKASVKKYSSTIVWTLTPKPSTTN